jgi:ATP phosphoribosyltransferase
VAGKDTLLEEGRDIYEVCDLGFGECRLCICGYPEKKRSGDAGTITVATKYPNVAKSYFDAKGMDIDLIKLNGSVELAPVIGLSDVILDVVESGKTLEANGLAVLETVVLSSARLAVNKVSLKTKKNLILPLIELLKTSRSV